MAYVNVAEWKPDQVTDWLKGLDSILVPYIHSFLNNQVNGQQVLNLRPDDLEHLGVFKLGHQELILEAVEHLRHFHYELDRETLQILALRLSCLAHSLHNELNRNHMDSLVVSTQTLADVANIVTSVKPLVCWLDRPPFSGQLEYSARKSELLSLSLEMATCGQRDRFAERPVEEIRTSSGRLAVLADSIIQDIQDPLLLQPASLELVTLKKRSSDDLGFYIVPSYHGIHQIGELKLNSAAHQSGKLEPGDEIVQINYQTVVGWQVKQVMALFEESPTEVLLTVKKRPKHTKVYGQIYMKPYRLPSKKRATQNSFTRWHDNLPSPRPELLTIPDFEMPLPKSIVGSVESTTSVGGRLPSSSEEECELVDGNIASSPTSARLYLPKPRLPVQRRATITGASPLSKRAPVNLQQFWEELKLEREWRGVGSSGDKPRVAQLIQDCESRVNCARKYSSFDSLKDRNASCFLQDSKPDVVSSCQEREKQSGGVNELFASTQSMENRSIDDKDIPKLIKSGSDEVFTTNEVSEKSTGCDDVFKTVESLGRSSKRSTEIDEVFKTVDNANSTGDELSVHLRNKSVDSDNVFVSDNEKNESSEPKVSSLKEKIELFSKAPVQTDKPPAINKKIKPKVPARTFRLSPDKNIPPKVLARVVKDDVEDKPKEESTVITKPEPVRKEKGRLDKSYSTPAYDMTDVLSSEGKVKLQNILRPTKPVQLKTDPILEDSKSDKDDVEKIDSNVSARSSTHSSVDNTAESEKEVHGQIVETINKHLLRMDDEAEVEPKWKDQKTLANLDVEHPPDETETEQKIGQILETINSSLIERRKEMERESKIRKPSEGVDLSKTISQVCQEEILQTYNPSGFSSDKVEQDFVTDKVKSSTVPLLPRVRITPPSVHEEIHGLPDVTLINQPPETPKRKPTSNFDCVDKSSPPAPATFPRQKVDARRPLTPPEPPPRPTPPASSITHQFQSIQQPQHKGACYRAMMVARSVGKSATTRASSVASPRALRKKNPLLAKHRNVSVKDLGACECQGWLQQRCRKGSGQWNRGWFVIKGTTFYGFKNKEAHRAEVMISLPGFTVSAAEEVKSRKFAFKVYHTGTMFYFAADNQEELTAWVDSVTMATLTQDSHSEAILFSESEGEPSGDEGGGESCFSSPKMKKFAGLLSSPTKPSPQSAATPVDKSSDMQKKFGSLKKLRGKSSDHGEHTADCSSGGSSLDRKYLGFLGRGPSVPVPTAQFRSYRRVAPPLPRPLHQSAESVLTLDTRDESESEI